MPEETTPATPYVATRRDYFIAAALSGLTPAFVESVRKHGEDDLTPMFQAAAKAAITLAELTIQNSKP